MGLSAVLITFNEERNIEQCLSALSFADEIVIVDSGSTDRTVDIARQFTDKITTRQFSGFSDQRAAAMDIATHDWVLMVDADEFVTDELAAEIGLAVADAAFDGYRVPRLTYFMGKPIRHCGWYPDYQMRLVRRTKTSFPYRLVHEAIIVDGNCGFLKNHMLHYSYRTFGDWTRKVMLYSRAAAEQKMVEGRRCRVSDLVFLPGLTFIKSYVIKQGFRDGLHGFILCGLNACYAFFRYVALWEMGRSTERGEGAGS